MSTYQAGEYKLWLDKLYEHATFGIISINGGEPTLHPQLHQFIVELSIGDYAGCSIELITNLWWLKSEKSFEKMFPVLDKLDVLFCTIYPDLVQQMTLQLILEKLNIIRKEFPHVYIHNAENFCVKDVFWFNTFSEIKTLVSRCKINICYQLFADGRLGRCPFSRGVGTAGTTQSFDNADGLFLNCLINLLAMILKNG